MARPQVENGHTKIANELVEALARTYFSPAESKVFWAILRRTYGWNKKMDRISYSQIEESTGLDRRHVGPALKRLVNRGILICNNAGERIISEYGVQKDYEKWILSPIQVSGDTDIGNSTVAEIGNSSDTDLSNSLSLKQVTDAAVNLTPVSVPSDTGLGHSDTDIGNRSDTDLSNHKRQKHYTKDIIQKNIYGEFNNVFLSEEEKRKLTDRLGKNHTDGLIEKLSAYMKQNPANEKKYKDHYATILNWSRRESEANGTYKHGPRKIPVAYTTPENI